MADKKEKKFLIDNPTLKNFAETNGNFSNLTANEVYSHLQSNQ